MLAAEQGCMNGSIAVNLASRYTRCLELVLQNLCSAVTFGSGKMNHTVDLTMLSCLRPWALSCRSSAFQ